MKVYLALVALVACGSVDDQPDLDVWCQSHFCQPEAITYAAADDAMLTILQPALERFQYATGRFALRTDPDGIPVTWEEGLVGNDGAPACAVTTSGRHHGSQRFTQLIRIDPRHLFCPDPEVSLLHELIHAMAPDAKHVAEEGFLFSGGVGRSQIIDAPSLERLCDFFACTAFKPELRAPSGR